MQTIRHLLLALALSLLPAAPIVAAVPASLTHQGRLTVNGVNGVQFDVNIVPHTMSETIFDQYQVGSSVNIEVDVLARYVERLLEAREDATT